MWGEGSPLFSFLLDAFIMYKLQRTLRGNDLVIAINCAAGLSIFFFGVSDQRQGKKERKASL